MTISFSLYSEVQCLNSCSTLSTISGSILKAYFLFSCWQRDDKLNQLHKRNCLHSQKNIIFSGIYLILMEFFRKEVVSTLNDDEKLIWKLHHNLQKKSTNNDGKINGTQESYIETTGAIETQKVRRQWSIKHLSFFLTNSLHGDRTNSEYRRPNILRR